MRRIHSKAEVPIEPHDTNAIEINLPRRRFSISSRVLPGFVVALDSIAVISVGLVSFYAIVAGTLDDPGDYAAAISFVWLTNILLMNFTGLYQFDAIMRPIAFADKISVSFGTTILFLLAAAFALKISTQFSRIWMVSFAVGAWTATMLFRVLMAYFVGRLADRRVFTRNVVIVGVGDQATALLSHLQRTQPRFISVLGLFSVGPDQTESGLSTHPLLGSFDRLPAFARTTDVDDVIIALPWSADDQIEAIVDKLRELPMNVYLASDLIGLRLPLRPPPDHFGELSLVELMGRPMAGWGFVQKAALDYSVGLVLTALLLPFMGLIALAIKFDSGGPVLFRQERYGFVNKIFRIYKFRTMKHEETPEELTMQATRNDPRVTRVGRFLRRTSLDELPQLFNVLGGTMSLVGPRPHAIDHNEAYAQVIRSYFARHRVKPGITGWAQVNGLRGETKQVGDMEARVKHDVYYTENWSIFFDLKILLMTVATLLSRRNAY